MEALDKILKRLQCNYDHPQPQAEQDCGNEKVWMAPHVIAKKVLMSEAAVLFISLNPNLSLWITQEAGQDMKMRSSCGRYCTVTEPKENETISRRSWQLASEWRALDKISVIAMQLPIILSLQLLINFYSIGGLMSLKGRGRARLVEMEGPIGYLAAVFSALGQNSGFVRSENL
ncbi:hypothetical protein CUMW_251450, partial [Citrus unshiu]